MIGYAQPPSGCYPNLNSCNPVGCPPTRNACYPATPAPPKRPEPQAASDKFFPPSKYVAVAAQYVYYGAVSRLSMIAHVTLTDHNGNVIIDTHVRPSQPVCDYRTEATGLLPAHLANAPNVIEVRNHVATHIRGKILVGHALWQFLSGIGLPHPALDTRDTALFLPFRRSLGVKPRTMLALPVLVARFMNRKMGSRGEVPVEEARAALDLFFSCEDTWELVVATGGWPCALPPVAYAACFT